jgi:hypothetical protein
MPQDDKRRTDVPTGFKSRDGYDLMAGREMKLTPTCPPKLLPKIPQLGLNMGMDVRRP